MNSTQIMLNCLCYTSYGQCKFIDIPAIKDDFRVTYMVCGKAYTFTNEYQSFDEAYDIVNHTDIYIIVAIKDVYSKEELRSLLYEYIEDIEELAKFELKMVSEIKEVIKNDR